MVITVLLKTGEDKSVCEDSLLVGDHIIRSDGVRSFMDDQPSCIAVADGVGGNAGGADASQFLLEYIARNLNTVNDGNHMQKFLREANEQLLKFGSITVDKADMATTFSGIFWIKNHMYISHVGNTRIYTKQGDYLKQITTDHTTYQWLMMHSDVQKAEDCDKSEIISCFGGGSSDLLKMLTVSQTFEGYEPSAIILTSDGIHDYIDIDTFEEILSEDDLIEKKLEKVWEKARSNGSIDDCSIIVVEK